MVDHALPATPYIFEQTYRFGESIFFLSIFIAILVVYIASDQK